eukprot:4820062-Alexandrium_andersonii.AAC.1
MGTGTWDGALLVLALVCRPEVQVLAARELGADDDGEYEGLPNGWTGEKVDSMNERRRRVHAVQELPED